ncbi:hypothetical protein GJ496_000567 [Pomphorhynchus laevis]|nr:hypothetical protein GJ496_000567 [Pomphorhynchus laevis]
MPFSFGGFAAKSSDPSSATTTTTSSLFSLNVNPLKTTTASSFLFQTPASTGSGIFGKIGQQATQPVSTLASQVPQVNEDEIILRSITVPQLFGDQRDTTITKWNQLQLLHGNGTVFCGPNLQTKVNNNNQYAAFKSFTFATKPSKLKDDSVVALLLRKSLEDVRSQKQTIIDIFHKMFESSPNVSIEVEGIKPLPNDTTELLFRVIEKQPLFALDKGPFVTSERRIPANDVIKFIESAVQKSATTTAASTFSFSSITTSQQTVNWKTECEKLGFADIFPQNPWAYNDLDLYLSNPPDGISPALWKQANMENPEPEELMPIPVIGFKGVKDRLCAQTTEAKIQIQQMNKIEEQIDRISKNVTILRSRYKELIRCSLSCRHQMLQILVRLNVKIKPGFALSRDEETLYARLSNLLSQVMVSESGPKNRLSVIKEKLTQTSNIYLPEEQLKDITEILHRLQNRIEILFDHVTRRILQLSQISRIQIYHKSYSPFYSLF